MDWLSTKRIRAKTRQRNVEENGEIVLKEIVECCDGKCNAIKNFSYNQIIKATNHFSQSNRASRIDVYYRCYKGVLDGRPVLIKKGKYTLDTKEICRDIAISSTVSGHKNFLTHLRALADLFIKPYDDVRFPLHHHVSKILRKFGYAEVIYSDKSRNVSVAAASPVKPFLRLALRCIGRNLGDPFINTIQVAKELKLIEKSAILLVKRRSLMSFIDQI